VQKQVEVGLDLVSDGEFSKPSYATYVSERLSGFGGKGARNAAADLLDYRTYAAHLVKTGGVIPSGYGSCCQGPVAAQDTSGLETDLANLHTAVDAARPNGAFMNAASPGVVAIFQRNEFYPDDESYLAAVADALQGEYEAIVEAGFLLQVDSPDLAMGRHLAFAAISDDDFLKVIDRNVDALNHALRNIPADRLRMHLCWGNYPGPHHRDIPLAKIAERVLRARPRYILLEGANPRHAHEWAVFETVKLPDDKVLVPGVIDSTSNYIEHPELVAERIVRLARLVGPERVVASTDCGFAQGPFARRVHPTIMWAKLRALADGAARAATELGLG
jgi:5-methyltetrahydropteroyltriglutamate--homocysteine methyltransferase